MAQEVYRIEIPIETEDRYSEGIDRARNKVNRFQKATSRMEQRMQRLQNRRWQMAINARDRATRVIRRISSFAERVTSRAYNITLTAVDMATRPIRGMAQSMAGTLGMLGVVGGGYVGVYIPLKLVAERQNMETAFQVLLGSADAAEKRIEELTQFAQDTPFMRDKIFEASRVLQVFTDGALATGEGLEMVGDIASGTQQPFSDVALWIGRMYDAMESGRPIGEMGARLQEMGAISGEQRVRFEELAESGKDIEQIWPEVTKEFNRFDGMMEEVSKNLGTLFSFLKAFGQEDILRPIGEGLERTIGPALEKFKDWQAENRDTIEEWKKDIENFAADLSGNILEGSYASINFVWDNYLNNEEFQDLSFSGKVRFVLDDVSAAFSDWWDEGGEDKVTGFMGDFGETAGTMINKAIMSALGQGEGSDGEGGFASAGGTAARSFISGFMEELNAMDIAGAIGKSLRDVNWSAVTKPSAENFGNALIANLLALGIGAKIAGALGLGKLLKGIGRAGGWVGRKSTGRRGSTSERNQKRGTRSRNSPAPPPYVSRREESRNNRRSKKGNKAPLPPATRREESRRNRKESERRRNKNISTPSYDYNRRSRSDNTSGKSTRSGGSGSSGRSNKGMFSGFKAVGKGVGKRIPGVSLLLGASEIAGAQNSEQTAEAVGGTAGGMGGAMAGASAGAALGSFVPGIGTAVGGVAGGIAGGLGGDQVGRKIGEWANGLDFSGAKESISDFASSAGNLFTGVEEDAEDKVGDMDSKFGRWFGNAKNEGVAGLNPINGDVNSIMGGIPNTTSRYLTPLKDQFHTNFRQASYQGEAGLSGLPGGVNNIVGQVPVTTSRILNPLSTQVFNEMDSARSSGVSGINGMPGDVSGVISGISPQASSVFSGLETEFRGYGANLSNAVTGAFNSANETASSLTESMTTVPVVEQARQYAQGGFINRPHLGLVGEDGPEAIIPMSSGKRGRALDLYNQVGEQLGVQPYANGGFAGRSQSNVVPMDRWRPGLHQNEEMETASSGTQTVSIPSGDGVTIQHLEVNIDASGNADIDVQNLSNEVVEAIAEQLGIAVKEQQVNRAV